MALTSLEPRIIHAHDFIIATPKGQLDFERAKKLLVDIMSASAPFIDYEILLDTRRAQSELSAIDLWQLVIEIFNFRKPLARKTAVLCPLEQFDQAEFFALCAKNRGFNVSAFTSFEDAIEWLIPSG